MPALCSTERCLETLGWLTGTQAVSAATVAPPRSLRTSIRQMRIGSLRTLSIAATISTVSADSGSFPTVAFDCCFGLVTISLQQGAEGENWPPAQCVFVLKALETAQKKLRPEWAGVRK